MKDAAFCFGQNLAVSVCCLPKAAIAGSSAYILLIRIFPLPFLCMGGGIFYDILGSCVRIAVFDGFARVSGLLSAAALFFVHLCFAFQHCGSFYRICLVCRGGRREACRKGYFWGRRMKKQFLISITNIEGQYHESYQFP